MTALTMAQFAFGWHKLPVLPASAAGCSGRLAGSGASSLAPVTYRLTVAANTRGAVVPRAPAERPRPGIRARPVSSSRSRTVSAAAAGL